jgi:arsenate reductase
MLEVLTNPRCSKCRQALSYLDSRGLEYRVREYLVDPLSVEELRTLQRRLGLSPPRWMRETVGSTAEEQLRAIAERPELMQRPIVIDGERAVLARSLPDLADWLSSDH